MNPNCRECYAAKSTSSEKGHILVKYEWHLHRSNFLYNQKGFCKSRVSIFIEIFSSSFLLMLSYSASVSPYYNYSSLITSTSQFSIYLPRSVGLGFRFFLCLNFWKQPSLSASKKCFLGNFVETSQ